MALANVAVLLAKWGYRVLIVDWDLEAPGLDRYFDEDFPAEARLARDHDGIIEYAGSIADNKEPDWTDLVVTFPVAGSPSGLDLIPAGRQDTDYARRLQRIDWDLLFTQHDFANRLEAMRDEWRLTYDYILVDSRTGITDIGGICTIYLPDIIVALTVANHQSLQGVADIVKRAARARQSLPVTRRTLICVPVPARDESRTEYKRTQFWHGEYVRLLGAFYEDLLPEGVTASQALDVLRIPYVPYWSFGEGLPVLTESLSDANLITYYYVILARLISTGFSWPESGVADPAPRPLPPTGIWRRPVRPAIAAITAVTCAVVSAVISITALTLTSRTHSASGPTQTPALRLSPTPTPSASPPAQALWAGQARAAVISSPVVADGVVYVGDESGRLYALNGQSGSVLWTTLMQGSIDTEPFVTNNTVYVATTAGLFYAVNSVRGTIEWITDLGSDPTSAVAAGHVLYVGDANERLFALSSTNGRILWAFTTSGPVKSAPLVSNNVVYVSATSRFYSLSAKTGRLIWQASGTSLDGTPALAGDVIYVGSHPGKLYALDSANGATIWTAETAGPIASAPAFSAGILYVSGGKHLYAFNAARGNVDKVYPAPSSTLTGPVVNSGVIYVGAENGTLLAINAANSQILATYHTGSAIFSNPAVSTSIGLLCVGTNKGLVIAYNPSVASVPQTHRPVGGSTSYTAPYSPPASFPSSFPSTRSSEPVATITPTEL